MICAHSEFEKYSKFPMRVKTLMLRTKSFPRTYVVSTVLPMLEKLFLNNIVLNGERKYTSETRFVDDDTRVKHTRLEYNLAHAFQVIILYSSVSRAVLPRYKNTRPCP